MMPGELWPVVERDGASEAAWQRLEHGGKMACCAVRLSVLGPLDEGEAGGAFMGDEDALAILGKEHEVGFPMSRHVARAGFGRAFAQRTALLDDVDHGAALLSRATAPILRAWQVAGSEERRVGKAFVRTCRSRLSP